MSVDATGKHIVKMIIILLRLVMLIIASPGPKQGAGHELTRSLIFSQLAWADSRHPAYDRLPRRVGFAAPGLREFTVKYVERVPPTADASRTTTARYVGRVPPKADPSGQQEADLWN